MVIFLYYIPWCIHRYVSLVSRFFWFRGRVFWLLLFFEPFCSQVLHLAHYNLKFYLFHRFFQDIRGIDKYVDKIVPSSGICLAYFSITSPKMPRRLLRLSVKKYAFGLWGTDCETCFLASTFGNSGFISQKEFLQFRMPGEKLKQKQKQQFRFFREKLKQKPQKQNPQAKTQQTSKKPPHKQKKPHKQRETNQTKTKTKAKTKTHIPHI